MLPIVFAGVAAVASFSGAWMIQEQRYGQVLAEMAAQHSAAVAKANADALAATQRLQAAKDKALKAAAARQSALARDVAAARSQRDGLRDELTAASISLSGASCGSIRDYASTVNDVLGQCATALEQLASQADGHASDSLMLQNGWPK